MVDSAEGQVKKCKIFREEIEKEIEEHEKRLTKIRRMFETHINDHGEEKAILTHKMKEYTGCFGKFSKQKLLDLLDDDMRIWNEELQ